MLTLICGIPNAGKTTYASQYDNVIHMDDMPIKGGQFRNCATLAREVQGDVCVEGVFGLKKHRLEVIRQCRQQTPKVCIWIDTPLDECVRREYNYRKRPLSIVHRCNDVFEPPTLEEGWDEIRIIKGEQQ